jgi:glutamyl/glutaminyl-tRNA synthetase
VENTRQEITSYRGRLAPSPTGYLHLGHALTFWTAQQRARECGGKLVLRIEDLDRERCRPELRDAILEDLRWFGFQWSEGPDISGPFAPYVQSERSYLAAWEKLRAGGFVYPCRCSRRDVQTALGAPHEGRIGRLMLDAEPPYPGTCRPSVRGSVAEAETPTGASWRFHVPDGEELSFVDERLGVQRAIAGVDFGDFVIWRKDNIPAYQLAVVVDDAAMHITEVVRGEDLLTSTFRQLLLYRALELTPPRWHHCALVTDEFGRRLAKRHDALSLRTLRARGVSPEELRSRASV